MANYLLSSDEATTLVFMGQTALAKGLSEKDSDIFGGEIGFAGRMVDVVTRIYSELRKFKYLNPNAEYQGIFDYEVTTHVALMIREDTSYLNDPERLRKLCEETIKNFFE